jgi:hypothetical protein
MPSAQGTVLALRAHDGLPPSVRVGPFDFQIMAWAPYEAARREATGEIDRIGLVIRIRGDLPLQRKRETLWHEILHAIWLVGAIDNLVPGEENVITSLSPNLFQVMRDNPSLVAWSLSGAI